MHIPVVHEGPHPEGSQALQRFGWALSCARCHRAVRSTCRWARFMHTTCSDPAPPRLVAGCHSMVKAPTGGWQCSRCARTADAAHRTSASRQRCPVPEVWLHGSRSAAGEAHLLAAHLRIQAWHAWRRGSPHLQLAQQPGASPPEGVRLRPWRDHHLLHQTGPGRRHWICGRCGAHALHAATLRDRPCGGTAVWPKYSRLVLAAGGLDAALMAAPPEATQAAIRHGWVRPAVRPAWPDPPPPHPVARPKRPRVAVGEAVPAPPGALAAGHAAAGARSVLEALRRSAAPPCGAAQDAPPVVHADGEPARLPQPRTPGGVPSLKRTAPQVAALVELRRCKAARCQELPAMSRPPASGPPAMDGAMSLGRLLNRRRAPVPPGAAPPAA